MTFGENEKIKSVIRKRLVELHPENCEYCGGFHQMRLSRDGMTIVSSNGICSELLVRANKIGLCDKSVLILASFSLM